MVVEISGGLLATRQESAELVEAQRLRHAVLWDRQNRNHESYGIKSWPSAYLIGADGKVFWEGNPGQVQNREKENQRLKELIEAHLRKSAE